MSKNVETWPGKHLRENETMFYKALLMIAERSCMRTPRLRFMHTFPQVRHDFGAREGVNVN